MRLTTKGLLLIAIPAVFELALLTGVVKAQADATMAERWRMHSEEVLRQTTEILDPVLSESVALRGAVLANDAHFTTPIAVWMDVDRRIDELAELVADDPAQVERVAEVRQAVQAYRQWSDRIQDMLHAGRTGEILARFHALAQADVLDHFRVEVTAFQAEERRLDSSRSNAVAAVREREQTLIVAAALGSLLFVALAVWMFTRGVRGRLALLSDNAGRLAGNEPLAPLGAGSDEIARLDLTLHETSRRLLEAERIEARFHADLEWRAAELARSNETLRQQTQENEMFNYSVSHDLRAPLVNRRRGWARRSICRCRRRVLRARNRPRLARLRLPRRLRLRLRLRLRRRAVRVRACRALRGQAWAQAAGRPRVRSTRCEESARGRGRSIVRRGWRSPAHQPAKIRRGFSSLLPRTDQ
ncbi:CHASE3 domain sensor protein [Paraburkholderia sp. UCT70]